MKRRWIIFFNFIFLLCLSETLRAAESNEFQYKGKKFKIQANIKSVPGPLNPVRIDYTVRFNKKIIQPYDPGGGTLFGCTLNSLPESLPKNIIKPVSAEGVGQIGWLIEVAAICGNTLSYRYHFIYPLLAFEATEKTYQWSEFVSKNPPMIQFDKTSQKVDIWYAYQEWGKTGTAGSFLVPRKFSIDLLTESTPIISEKLPADFNTWPKIEGVEGFASYFVSGYIDQNPELMKMAYDKLYQEKDKDIYALIGLPRSKQEVDRLIEAVKNSKEYFDTFLRR